MRNPSRLALPVALLAAGLSCWLAFGRPAAAQEKAKAAPKWEYRVITLSPSDNLRPFQELDKSGEDGFRLVSTTTTSVGQNAVGPTTVFVLERAKP